MCAGRGSQNPFFCLPVSRPRAFLRVAGGDSRLHTRSKLIRFACVARGVCPCACENRNNSPVPNSTAARGGMARTRPRSRLMSWLTRRRSRRTLRRYDGRVGAVMRRTSGGAWSWAGLYPFAAPVRSQLPDTRGPAPRARATGSHRGHR